MVSHPAASDRPPEAPSAAPGEPAAFPLIARRYADILCHRQDGPVTVASFLGQAMVLAERLPPAAAFAINLCSDRYLALLGFAAALLRGHVTLLNAQPSPQRLAELAADYPGAYALTDCPVEAAPVPLLRLDAIRLSGLVDVPRQVPAIPADRLAAIGFTSGSTGIPTAHHKPWGALVAAARAAAERFGFEPGDGPASSIVATVPPQHMYGFETTMVLPLHAAVAPYAGPSFFPADVLEALAALPAPRVLVTTPLHLRTLIAEGGRPSRLAAAISATAPLAADLAEAVERDWGTPMLEIYGATEAGSLASRRTVSEPDWLPYDGVAIGPGSVATVPGLGAVPLADVIEPTPGGRFRLVGRIADMVKLGGRRASLAELNRRLSEVEGVRDGVFVAPEDLEHNPAARLTAYVVAPGRTAEDILAGLRGRVDPVFLPRPVVLVAALPRNAVGKLPRAALAALEDAADAGEDA